MNSQLDNQMNRRVQLLYSQMNKIVIQKSFKQIVNEELVWQAEVDIDSAILPEYAVTNEYLGDQIPFSFLFIYLPPYRSIYQHQTFIFTILFMYISIYQSINLSIYQSIMLSIYQSINLSIYQSINLSIYQSTNLSIYQSINLSI